MPTIVERTLESGTIGEALTSAWCATLPLALAEDDLVRWALSYGEQNPNYSEYWRPSELREFSTTRKMRWIVLGQLCRNLLSSRLPIYIEALFAFGRPMRATEFAMHDCEMVLKNGNLRAAASQISKALGGSQGSNEEAHLQTLATQALKYRQNQWERYENVRKSWEVEVSELHIFIKRVEERFQSQRGDERLSELIEGAIDLQFRASSLPAALSAAGISAEAFRLSWDTAESDFSGKVLPTLGLAVLAGLDPYEYERIVGRTWRQIASVEYEKAIAPRVARHERLLSENYGGVDPFASYDLGKGPPTPKLLMLVQENRLIGKHDSIWLERWQSGLLDSWNLTPPQFEDRLKDETILWAALGADSRIKHTIVDKDLGDAASFPSLLQEVFEKEWIQGSAEALVDENAGKLRDGWDTDEFLTYVLAVVRALNAQGYALTVPNRGRIEALLMNATRSDRSSTSDDGR